MRNTFTSGSIIGNRRLTKDLGRVGSHHVWIWECLLCGGEGRQSTSSLARAERKNSTPKCCNKGINNKHYIGSEYLTQDYITRLRRMALSRGLEFSVTFEDLESLLIKQDFKCALSGVSLPPRNNRNKDGASLDRIDSTVGYSIDNVQWIHAKLNVMKMALPNDEFINWCHLVSKNNE